jgi:hypothetical protein
MGPEAAIVNHRELQALEERRDIGAERAALEHLQEGIERYTILPTSELLKDIDVLEIEERLAANLDKAYAPVLGALRAARLLESETAEDLRKALELIAGVQRAFAEKRGER